MDFALNEQQEMMQTLARDFLSSEYSDKVLRAMAADDKGFTPELWRKMAEMNLMGISIPEEYGGAGDFVDLVVVLEQMGRSCFISPYFSTVALGASAIMEAGSEEQKQHFLPEIAEGKLRVTLALLEAHTAYTPEGVTIKAVEKDGGYVINGTKVFVPDAHTSDYLICAARTDKGDSPDYGISLFIVDINTPGIKCDLLKTINGDKLCNVTLENVRVSRTDMLGKLDKGWQYVEKVLERASVAACAEMVGGAQGSLDMTIEYAREREAFGHPIGAFQSMQHLFADMLIDIEGARFLTYQAAWRINEGMPAGRETAIAKAWVNQAAQRVANSAHQIHGAIGFTEDHILHFYTKRARAREFGYGDTDFHLERLASIT